MCYYNYKNTFNIRISVSLAAIKLKLLYLQRIQNVSLWVKKQLLGLTIFVLPSFSKTKNALNPFKLHKT